MAQRIIALLFSFVLSPTFAADAWTKAQAGQQVAFTVLLAADWAQTREIADDCRTVTHPGGTFTVCERTEWNPILGEQPDPRDVDRYFAIAAVGHLAIAHVLPRKWRDVWQYAWIGIEAGVVHHNYQAGIRIEF